MQGLDDCDYGSYLQGSSQQDGPGLRQPRYAQAGLKRHQGGSVEERCAQAAEIDLAWQIEWPTAG